MKKFFLSVFVIVVFAAYALHQRFGDSEGGNVVAPKTLQSANQISSTPNPISTPTIAGSSPPIQTSKQITAPTPTPVKKTTSPYKDGEFTGNVADAYYGNVQVKAIILSGKITDVQFLDYPQDRNTSVRINSQAMPYLTSEAIQAQNANVDTISGATQTSRGFRESLQSALDKAKN